MAAKITRLNDPNNPYNIKRTPTSAPSAAQQARNKAASDALRAQAERDAMRPKPAVTAPLMQRANEQYMDSRQKAIDNQIDRATMARTLRRAK